MGPGIHQPSGDSFSGVGLRLVETKKADATCTQGSLRDSYSLPMHLLFVLLSCICLYVFLSLVHHPMKRVSWRCPICNLHFAIFCDFCFSALLKSFAFPTFFWHFSAVFFSGQPLKISADDRHFRLPPPPPGEDRF